MVEKAARGQVHQLVYQLVEQVRPTLSETFTRIKPFCQPLLNVCGLQEQVETVVEQQSYAEKVITAGPVVAPLPAWVDHPAKEAVGVGLK